MIKNILHTIFTKFSSAGLGFLIIILISQVLGAEAKGEQAILVYNINLMLMCFTLIGNSTLIYLVPRKNFNSLIIPSLLWVGICAIVAGIIFIFFIKAEVFLSIICVLIAILASISEINQFILL
jgi:hypothetical protein